MTIEPTGARSEYTPSKAETNTGSKTRVLVVDDETTLARSLARALELRGFYARAVDDATEAVRLAQQGEVDVMLVDLNMPKMSGMEVLAQVKRDRPDVEVLMMTAYGDVDTAVAAVKAGAYDFFTKPFPSNDAVALAVEQAAEHRRLLGRTRELEHEIDELENALHARDRFGDILGTSPRMVEVYRLVEGVAATTSTVLILGESGTGKELVARAIHQRSMRRDKPFVVVNCGAIPSELVESELFGHVKGAFTGATSARQGLFEAADKGTLFLDEVGDLPLSAQVKLLRTLQEGEVKRVGSNEARTVDVRVIAATNVDLRQRVREGRFREDLYYRLDVISIVLPPLRERRQDIPLLANHFLRKYAARTGKRVSSIAPAALRAMETYSWPGNVRELENAIERAVVLARSDTITLEDLPSLRPGASRASTTPSRWPPPTNRSLADLPYTEARRRALIEFERAYVTELLSRARGNISQAAREAGLDRSNFKRVLRRVRAFEAQFSGEQGSHHGGSPPQ